jgi:REP element-mobilizing transposase RayT
MCLNGAGEMIEKNWGNTISAFENIVSEKYIVMPNHFHSMLSISRANTRFAPTVGAIIQAFKSKTTVEYIYGVKAGIYPPFHKRIWQRNYYEHIIRDEEEFQATWQYINENPEHWTEDEYYR